jgi:hypothetical protein
MRDLQRISEALRYLVLKSTPGAKLFFMLTCSAGVTVTQSLGQETYPSAQQATAALFAAVQSHDEQAVARILGGDKSLVSTGDGLGDDQDRKVFLEKYQQMHRLVQEPDGTTVLYVGAENWPFPVPLVERKDKWLFNGKAGMAEVLFRRIGENEENSLQACAALSSSEQSPSGISQGYYFRHLGEESNAGADDVIFIAYPAEYRSSGVMTFVVTSNHAVFEKDLGPRTTSIASTAHGLRLDRGWRQVQQGKESEATDSSRESR